MLIRIIRKFTAIILVIMLMVWYTTPAFALDDTSEKMTTSVISQNNDLLESDAIEYEKIEKAHLEDEQIKDMINDPSKGINDLKEAILTQQSYVEGLTTKLEINNISSFKTALELKYPEMSDIELGETILLTLGDSEEFIATLPDEKIIEAIGYTSVVKTESFFKQTADGEKIEMSEEDYYDAIALLEANEQSEDSATTNESASLNSASISSSAYDETETLDSYIKLTSTAYKTNPSYALDGRNYFTIRGEVEWTKSPMIRGKDILAIASSGNVDQNYQSYAYAYWMFYDDPDFTCEDWAYIGKNGGEGELSDGYALKIYNPSIYGVAVDVQIGLMQNTGDLQYAYVYYGISTQEDVTCQVGYAHKTVGIGDPSVSIDSSGSLSFSIGLVSTMNEYMGQSFTLYHESYSVSLISPSANASISCNATVPTFYWQSPNGLSKQYILEIDYLNNGTYMSRSINTSTSYALSTSDWDTIINDSPFISSGVKRINWRIKINYIIYPDEVPYCTEWSTFTITGVPMTSEETLPIIAANNRYTEKVIYLDSGAYKDIKVTFASSGNRVVQTFGTIDTFLELYSSDGTKLLGQADTDDDGYSLNALFSYNFSANTSYTIRVKFCSSSAYGNTKLAIVPTYHHDNYEAAYGTYSSTTVSSSLGNNAVALFRYKFDSSGIATFSMSADADSYIYIIDPTSTAVIARFSGDNTDIANLYDDDSGGNLQAQLSKYVQAGKEYLVIISFYNPSTMSGEFSITSRLIPALQTVLI